MSKITDYSAASRFDNADVLLKDGTNGTKKILATDAASEFAGMVSAINHRNVYRGKNLGTSVSSAQKAAIQSGSFDDLFIGDYWVINDVTWVIADMDYFYNCGDTAFTKHHLVIVPNSPLYNAAMSDEEYEGGHLGSTRDGYAGSKMYTENLDSAKATIAEAFGDMVLSHRELFTNEVTDGYPTGFGWYDSTVDLMNEIMVYGAYSYVFTPCTQWDTVAKRWTVAKQQLALFALNPRAINIRASYWLRDVANANWFAIVDIAGHSHCGPSPTSYAVRPEFCIG